MRLLLVHAHPAPDSYGRALLEAAREGAVSGGHAVEVIDLHAEGFDPVMGEEEWRGYYEEATDPALRRHAEALGRAEGVVFVYPTWWQGQPAILKGWIDRVWRPGVAFHMPGKGLPLRPALTGLRLIGVVTTLGMSWPMFNLAMGAPGRRIMLRGLRFCTARRTRTFWLAQYGMDAAPAAAREAFLRRVRERMARL
jgi:NAD(P)H dehydrogenase (quinone)